MVAVLPGPVPVQGAESQRTCDPKDRSSRRAWAWARVWTTRVQGITEVRSDAFKDIKYTLLNVWLDDNQGLMSLTPDVFDELDVLMNLSLMRTGVTDQEERGEKDFENLFLDGMNVSSMAGDTLLVRGAFRPCHEYGISSSTPPRSPQRDLGRLDRRLIRLRRVPQANASTTCVHRGQTAP